MGYSIYFVKNFAPRNSITDTVSTVAFILGVISFFTVLIQVCKDNSTLNKHYQKAKVGRYKRSVFAPLVAGIVYVFVYYPCGTGIPSILHKAYSENADIFLTVAKKSDSQLCRNGLIFYEYGASSLNLSICNVKEDVWNRLKPGGKFKYKVKRSKFGISLQ